MKGQMHNQDGGPSPAPLLDFLGTLDISKLDNLGLPRVIRSELQAQGRTAIITAMTDSIDERLI